MEPSRKSCACPPNGALANAKARLQESMASRISFIDCQQVTGDRVSYELVIYTTLVANAKEVATFLKTIPGIEFYRNRRTIHVTVA